MHVLNVIGHYHVWPLIADMKSQYMGYDVNALNELCDYNITFRSPVCSDLEV